MFLNRFILEIVVPNSKYAAETFPQQFFEFLSGEDRNLYRIYGMQCTYQVSTFRVATLHILFEDNRTIYWKLNVNYNWVSDQHTVENWDGYEGLKKELIDQWKMKERS